jgi:outer membrane protein OmpA-like peptidoglycan-associated protein
MKKITLAIQLILILTVCNAQKKWNQFSFRGGIDQAQKTNFSEYTNGKMKGINVGVSYDKYWDWYGLGLDFDFMKNKAPEYIKEGEMIDSIRRRSGNAFLHNVHYTNSGSNKDLTRAFFGLGPSFKLQNKKNNFVVELNTRVGVTYTNGAALLFVTNATMPAGTAWGNFVNQHLTRSGVIPTTAISGWTFKDDGYSNDLITTVKAQLRANYYFKPKLAAHLTAYYMHYEGEKTKYDYVDYIDVSPNPSLLGSSYWSLMRNLKQDLAGMNSYGITAGITYRWMKDAPTTAKTVKQKNQATINVKDELTGQPIRNAEVTITSLTGKKYVAITNDAGVANFEKIENGTYTATATLNGISTNEANFSVAKSKAEATLIHNDPRFTIVGKTINVSNNTPEAGVTVSLKNNDKGSVKMTTTQGNTGSFSFQLDANSDYQLVGKKDSYISNIENASTKGLNRSQTLYVELQIGIEKVDVGKPVALNNILYDLDKSNIREDASSDLQKLIRFMQDNPTFNVQISSHTDSRGSDEYNLTLAKKEHKLW